MQQKVSIIIPSFNQGKYIERTILSVLSQARTVPNIELIIMDGGSSDNTLEILKKYNSVIKWFSEPDKGFADAANKGLKLCTGDIIGLQSSDDIYTDNAIKTAVDMLDHNPDVSMVYGYFDVIDVYDNLTHFGKPLPTFSLDGYLCLDFVIPQPSAFFRRDVLNSIGYIDSEVDYVADMEFWLRMATKYKIMSVPYRFSCVRRHSDARNSSSTKFGRDWLKALEKNIKAGNLFLDKKKLNRVYAAAFVYSSIYELANGQLKNFFLNYKNALSSDLIWTLKHRTRTIIMAIVANLLIPKFVRDWIKSVRRKYTKENKVQYTDPNEILGIPNEGNTSTSASN